MILLDISGSVVSSLDISQYQCKTTEITQKMVLLPFV